MNTGKALLFVATLALSACSNGPSVPDGGIACSVAATCPQIMCNCPQYYKGCIDGVCAMTCPAVNLDAGQPCGYDCECAFGECALDTETCCGTLGTAGSGQPCQNDCDCAGYQCSSGSCT